MKPQKALHKYLADAKKRRQYLGHQYLQLPKVDGWYGYMDIGQVEGICSNAQRIIPSCADRTRGLVGRVNQMGAPKGRLIFELTVDGVPQFEKMNGILNRHAICPDIRLNVHDFVPAENKGMFTIDRYNMAREIVIGADLGWMEMIRHLGASSIPEEWESKAAQLIDAGHEGLILKKLEAGYTEGKRNEDLMKIKEECEFDLLVVGMQKGSPDGKYANTLGALVLQDKAGTKFVVSGMTDAQRFNWWTNKRSIVGKVVKVKAKNVMKDGSLREPRFVCVRFDKNPDDINIVE